MKKLNRKGFTLIEILVVVAIIGILAGVVLISLRGTGPQARDTRRVSELKSVQSALELYYNKEGQYPDSANWTDLTADLIAADLSITKVPNDPQGGTATYQYGVDSTNNYNNYVLGATLEVQGSSLVDNDVDGDDVFGVDCGSNGDTEVEYCIQL